MTVTGLPFPLKAKGKVREVFDLGEHYLIVATDRLSAFDVVMPNGVPGKGILLTHISLWWFEQAASVFPTHLVPDHLAAAGKLRMDNRQASLEELGQLHVPPLTKDAIAGRIRRLLALADKRAAELGATVLICEADECKGPVLDLPPERAADRPRIGAVPVGGDLIGRHTRDSLR